jgi:hypothetical protein
VYPPLPKTVKARQGALKEGTDGIFQSFDIALPERRLAATVTPVRAAQEVRPIMIGGLAKAAMQPIPESFRQAAAWRIDVPSAFANGEPDALVNLDFTGDIGRLFNGTRMLDDWYYSGYGWQYALKHAAKGENKGPLTLSVLPLRADAPIYIPKEGRPDFAGKPQISELRGVTITPVYRLDVR